MIELVTYLLKSIVDSPDSVSVTEQTTEFDYTNINIKVAASDMGKVIGKGGKIIRALRILTRVLAIKENKKYNLLLLEEDSLTEPKTD